jgi:acyl-coenzyme A thioesterase PaaI-like protein
MARQDAGPARQARYLPAHWQTPRHRPGVIRRGVNTVEPAFQDLYPDELSYCYGCGRLNEHGLHVKSYWLGDETVATFVPKPYHTAIPGYVYGGLIASLMDCHATGTAAAAAHRAAGRAMGTEPALRFVTASLRVDYLRPTPLGGTLEVRARVVEMKGRKVVVSATLSAEGQVCATGEIVAVQMPEHMAPAKGAGSPER